jgi:hypothetical protein
MNVGLWVIPNGIFRILVNKLRIQSLPQEYVEDGCREEEDRQRNPSVRSPVHLAHATQLPSQTNPHIAFHTIISDASEIVNLVVFSSLWLTWSTFLGPYPLLSFTTHSKYRDHRTSDS